MVDSDGAQYRLQSQLAAAYITMFLSNNHNTRDPQLIELEREMGGTPGEQCENGEYSAEANAMLYLNNRVIIERLRRAVFNGIRHTTELYAKGFERIVQIARSQWFPSSLRIGNISPDR
jgi:hypothetical protein